MEIVLHLKQLIKSLHKQSDSMEIQQLKINMSAKLNPVGMFPVI